MKMNLIIENAGRHFTCDLSKPMIASFSMNNGTNNPNAFHLPFPSFVPFGMGDFIGSTKKGGPVNCEILTLAPHGNGTHTECVGHIAKETYTIAQTFKSFHAFGALITVKPEQQRNGDVVISRSQLEQALQGKIIPQALMIRTQNSSSDLGNTIWSGNNPPYFSADAMELLAKLSIQHVLTDLPSVDPEEDGGALAAHHAFWQYPHATRTNATITEMLFIPDDVKDDYYLISFGIAPLQSDASPSTIQLYSLSIAQQ